MKKTPGVPREHTKGIMSKFTFYLCASTHTHTQSLMYYLSPQSFLISRIKISGAVIHFSDSMVMRWLGFPVKRWITIRSLNFKPNNKEFVLFKFLFMSLSPFKHVK